MYVDAENGEDGELLLPGPDGGLKLKKADACAGTWKGMHFGSGDGSA